MRADMEGRMDFAEGELKKMRAAIAATPVAAPVAQGDLPPLPKPYGRIGSTGAPYWLENQVRKYVQAATASYADRLVASEQNSILLSASLKQSDAVCSELTALVAALGGKVQP